MAVRISPKRQASGLHSNPNNSSGIPEGGLLEAENCTSERPGLLSKRRGFSRYGSALDGSLGSLMDYDGSLVVHSGAEIGCDDAGTGTLTSWGKKYQSPGGFHNIRGAGLKKNFYFTSSDGVYRNDSLTGTPELTGMPEGLDIQVSKYGTGDGWMAGDTQVAYRIVWSREDANKSLIIGEPSYRRVIRNQKTSVTLVHDGNSTVTVSHDAHGYAVGDIITISGSTETDYSGPGKTISVVTDDSYTFDFSSDLGPATAFASKYYDINLIFTVPEGIVTGDKYEIYRTPVSASGTTDPGDEHLNVVKAEITDAEVAAGTVEFPDDNPDVALSESLYTNSSQETISQRNTRPPQCKDIVEWKGHMFYSDLTYKSVKEIHLNEIEDIVAGDEISIKSGPTTYTYKFLTQESAERRDFLIGTLDDTTEENIETTARSLVRVINRDPNNTLFYAHYSSGVNDSSGKILIRSRDVSSGAFSITVSGSLVGASFKDEIPTSGESFSSDDNTRPNGLCYSKVLEPDSAPAANIIEVGASNYPIRRIFALKNSLVILKEDGAYKLSGNTPSTFILQTLDATVGVKCPNAAVEMNDSVYCLSTQGIVRVADNGTVAISYPIEDQLRNIVSFSGVERTAFAVADEIGRRLMVFTQKNSGDISATVAWVYNYLTKQWTTWKKNVKCGISLLGKREIYLGHAVDGYVLKERMGLSGRNSSDYRDEDISITVASSPTPSTTVQFTYDYSTPIRAGFLFTQVSVDPRSGGEVKKYGGSANIKSITSITGDARPYTVTAVLDRAINSIDATGTDGDGVVHSHTVSLPIDSVVKWAPDNLGISEIPKQFTYATITMESGTSLTNELGFYSDAVLTPEWVGSIVLATPNGWGSGAWGSSAWGDEYTTAVVPLCSAVPRQHQRCRELTVMYRHRVANEEFNIESIGLRYKLYRGKLVRTPE